MEEREAGISIGGGRQRAVGALRRSPAFLVGATAALLLVTSALLAPVIAPHDPDEQFRDALPPGGQALGPTSDFPLGTDRQGRDYLSRILYGTRTTLFIAIVANGIAAAVGLAVGLVAGFAGSPGVPVPGGRRVGVPVGGFLMRLTDLALAFPIILLALAMAAVFGRSVALVTFIIAAVVWATMARLVYGRTTSIREREFIEAAHAVGSSTRSIMVRHLVPHLVPLVVVYTGLGIAATVLFEATLSYVGAGVPRGTASLGGLLFEGAGFWQTDPRLVLLPGIVVMIFVLAFNLVSDALRDALDPHHVARR